MYMERPVDWGSGSGNESCREAVSKRGQQAANYLDRTVDQEGRLEREGGQLDQVGAERMLQVGGQRRQGEQAAVPGQGRVLAGEGPLERLQGQPGRAREPGQGGLVAGAGQLLDGDAGQPGLLHLRGGAGKLVHCVVALPVG